MKLETRKLKSLKPHPKNPKQHPDDQIAMLGGSIKEFGVTRAIVVDEHNVILAGHGQTAAGIAAGIEEMPVMVARGWSEEKKLAFLVADNRLNQISGYDETLLRENIGLLQEFGFDMLSVGYDQTAIDELLIQPTTTENDPDEVPEPPKKPIVKTGDLWLLGATVQCPKCKKVQPLENAVRIKK